MIRTSAWHDPSEGEAASAAGFDAERDPDMDIESDAPRVWLWMGGGNLESTLADLLEAEGFRVSVAAGPPPPGPFAADVAIVDSDQPALRGKPVPPGHGHGSSGLSNGDGGPRSPVGALAKALADADPWAELLLVGSVPPPAAAFGYGGVRLPGFLAKPFDPAWLARAAREAAARAVAARAAAKLRDDSASLRDRLRAQAGRGLLLEAASGLTHELKNLLSVINVSAQYARRKADNTLDPKVRKHLGIITDQVGRSQEIIARFGALAREARGVAGDGGGSGLLGGDPAAGAADSAAGPTDLNDTVRGLAGILEPSLAARGVSLRLDLQDGLPPAAAGEAALRHIVFNLLVNCRDALTPLGGGCVTLRTAGPAGPTAEGADGPLTVTVEDDGPGVPPSLAETVFEPFFTTKAATDPAATGLGLGIARRLARGFGGALTLLQSAPGAASAAGSGASADPARPGAVFTLRIPPPEPRARVFDGRPGARAATRIADELRASVPNQTPPPPSSALPSPAPAPIPAPRRASLEDPAP